LLDFAASPWDYDAVLEDELELEDAEADDAAKKYIHSKNADQHLDEEQRRFIWIMCRPLLEGQARITDIELYNTSFFLPDDLSKANPYNNWFLRFPECCPSFLFQQLVTYNGVTDLVNVSEG
jgi:hypothetical protein